MMATLSFSPEPAATADRRHTKGHVLAHARRLRWLRAKQLLLLLVLVSSPAAAAEISSNGTGGGPWTDPATWRGKIVPGPADDVIIQKHDVVLFDRNDDGKVSCHKLQLDPKGVLLFKTGAGKVVCCVSESIENFGVIKLDGTRSKSDLHELRLVGDKAEQRKITLKKGSSLLLYGMAGLAERNVALTAPPPSGAKEAVPGFVEADGQVMLDLQRAAVTDVKVSAKNLDNTGAKPNERLNVIDVIFTGQGRLACHTCDTPVLARNSFECNTAMPLADAAINLAYCPLAEVKGNNVRGGFNIGITINFQSDSVLMDNTIEKCAFGITGGYGVPNTMIKRCTLRGCQTGIKLEGASGVVEDAVVEGATTALHTQNATLQVTHLQVKDLPKGGVALLHEGNALSLLNCNVLPAQIKMGAQPAAKPPPVPVTAQHYLVIAVKGAPEGSLVDVRSQPPVPVDVADPHVRNTPAALVSGLSPLPTSFNPLIIGGWTMDAKGKVTPAPEYVISVLGPSPREGASRPILHKMTFRPPENLFRPTRASATPTLEVLVK